MCLDILQSLLTIKCKKKVFYSNRLIYGGLIKGSDDTYIDTNTFYEYDFETNHFEDLSITNPPTVGRHFHSAIVKMNFILFFLSGNQWEHVYLWRVQYFKEM
jgi:hypothetical protein